MVGLVETPADPNLAYWEDAAATEYRNRAKIQRDAVEAIGGQDGKADVISSWLMNIAKLNVVFISGLVKIVAEFLGALVTASLETATVVGIPSAPRDLTGAIGGLVTNGINRLAEIATRLRGTLASIRDAKGLMNDPGCPQGSSRRRSTCDRGGSAVNAPALQGSRTAPAALPAAGSEPLTGTPSAGTPRLRPSPSSRPRGPRARLPGRQRDRLATRRLRRPGCRRRP